MEKSSAMINALTDDKTASYWLSALVDSADDAIISKTLDGIITSWNKGAQRIFGYTAEEAVGKSILILIPTEYQAEEADILRKIKAGERVEHYETVRQRKDNSFVEVSLTVSPVKTPTGEIVGASKIARDISAAKQAEERLSLSEERYRTLFNSIDQGFCVIEMLFDQSNKPIDYRFLEINPVFEKMTGIAHDEALSGKTARELVPNLEDKWVEIYGRIALAGESVRFTEGSEAMNRWFEVYGFRVDAAAASRKVALLFNDITERKRAEEKLRESEENLRYTVELNPQVPWTAAPAGNIESFSDRWLEMTGLTHETALGEGWMKIQHPEDLAFTLKAWKHSVETGEPYDVEHRIRLADGSYSWVRSRAFPRLNEQGDTVRWYGTTEDIHNHKKADESLRESRKMLGLAMSSSRMGAWLRDLATEEVYWSEELEALFGLPAGTFAGNLRGFRDYVYAADKERIAAEVERAIAERRDYIIEFRFHHQDGTLRWMEGRGQAIYTPDGKPVKVYGIGIDITERKQAEREREELLQREQAARREAEEASRLKDEFLATVSHELRTPLNAIMGWSQMLASGRFSPSETTRAVETIYRNAKSQAQLIEDILDVSRIVTGKIRLEPKPILLSQTVQMAVESLRPAIEAKNIRMQMQLDFEPRMVNADPDRLQQVVWNLLSNAIKFTPEKGQVTIRLEADDRQTKILVSDTGKGINPEFLPYVFERFRQADGSSTRKHGGLGLGLSIVRHIVELHGGAVSAASSGENAGATFTVSLPLPETPINKVKELSADNRPSNERNGNGLPTTTARAKIKGCRVLIIDDETDTLELLAAVLRREGAEVKTKTSAAAALEIVRAWRPDIIVSDIAMPEEDGYSFIKRLRDLPPEQGGATPAIALTAYVGIKERTRVLESGFQMYVPKPVEPSELLGAIANFTSEVNNH